MRTPLRGRHLLSLAHHTPEEIRYLVDLSRDLKRAKYAGTEQQLLHGRNIALIFEKTSTRTRCAFEVAAYDQGAHVTFLDPVVVPDRAQGVDQGHRPRPRPDVRRDRVPRLLPGARRDPRGVRRRAGAQRADRRLPPDPDARRRADHDRAHHQAVERDRVRLRRRRPQQRGQLAAHGGRQARHGRPHRRAPRPVAGRRAGQAVPTSSPPSPVRGSPSPTTRRPPWPGSTTCTPTSGSRWASRSRPGTSGSSSACPTR